jgi:hypothetical protein
MGGQKYLDFFYKLRYFDHTNNGHGLIHLKTNIYGFEIAFFLHGFWAYYPLSLCCWVMGGPKYLYVFY